MIKINKDITEQEAFYNCLNFVENMPLMSKDESGIFCINFIKWLLNKFDLPYCYLEEAEKVTEKDGRVVLAYAQRNKSTIFIDYKNLDILNIEDYILNLIHEFTHISDYDYYTGKLLLGKNRNFQSPNGSFDIAENYGLPFRNDEDYIYYYLKDEEISARRTSEFYTILFLKLLLNSLKHPLKKGMIDEKLTEMINYSKISNEELVKYTFIKQQSTNYKAYLNAIKIITNNYIKKLETSLKNNEISVDLLTKIREMLLTTKNEVSAKKLFELYNKYNNREFRTVVLFTLAELPYNIIPEKTVNEFLLTEDNLTVACCCTAPEELAKRLLFIWGTKKFNKEIEKNKRNQNIVRDLVHFKKVQKEFEGYNILGLNNLSNTTMSKCIVKKFINNKFILNEATLNCYNKLTNGRFCTKINMLEQYDKTKEK